MERPTNTDTVQLAPIPTVDEDNLSPDQYEAQLSAQEQARLASRPNIDHLPDAVVKDEMGMWLLLAKPGEKIIIERFSSIFPGRPWMDTKVYTVHSVETVSGNIYLHDDDLQRITTTNIEQALKYGHRFKLPTVKVNLTTKRKRGRPRKNPLAPVPSKAAMAPTNEAPAKRGRGRPKGSKNRPKDVITAEKAAKKATRKVKAKAKKRAK
jgi:hypothetical protein